MIPNRMTFVWVGNQPMSWLRLQSVQTFAKFHPGWDIQVVHPTPFPLPGLARDTQADVLRWGLLADSGGWFADTDIIFTRSLEDEIGAPEGFALITKDGGTEGPEGLRFAIGLMAAPPGHPTIKELARRAAHAATASDHQSAGTCLLAAAWTSLPGRGFVKNLPACLLYPFGHSQRGLDKAWDPEVELPEDIIGLHWSGGHPSSRAAEQWATVEWARHSLVPVAQALRRAYA